MLNRGKARGELSKQLQNNFQITGNCDPCYRLREYQNMYFTDIWARPSDMKKAGMFYLSKRGMCMRRIKAQNMPVSVHYLHRHKKGADEPIISLRKFRDLSGNCGANVNMNREQNRKVTSYVCSILFQKIPTSQCNRFPIVNSYMKFLSAIVPSLFTI